MKCICEIFEKYDNPIICIPEDLSAATIFRPSGPKTGQMDEIPSASEYFY